MREWLKSGSGRNEGGEKNERNDEWKKDEEFRADCSSALRARHYEDIGNRARDEEGGRKGWDSG